VIMAAFGQTTAGIHIGVILVNSACIFLVFLIARRLIDPPAGVAAGATFGLFTIRPLLLGLAGHATHFVALAALASLFLLLKACGTNRYWIFFGSGICLFVLERMVGGGTARPVLAEARFVFSGRCSAVCGDLFNPFAGGSISEILVLDGFVRASLRSGNQAV